MVQFPERAASRSSRSECRGQRISGSPGQVRSLRRPLLQGNSLGDSTVPGRAAVQAAIRTSGHEL